MSSKLRILLFLTSCLEATVPVLKQMPLNQRHADKPSATSFNPLFFIPSPNNAYVRRHMLLNYSVITTELIMMEHGLKDEEMEILLLLYHAENKSLRWHEIKKQLKLDNVDNATFAVTTQTRLNRLLTLIATMFVLDR
jgi:hypothetical protein